MRRLRAAARRTVVEAETPAAASEPVQDERDEDGAADDPDDELDRELEGRDDGACGEVAEEHEESAHERGVGDRSAQVVALEERDEVRDNEADVGDAAHDGDDGGRDHGGVLVRMLEKNPAAGRSGAFVYAGFGSALR